MNDEQLYAEIFIHNFVIIYYLVLVSVSFIPCRVVKVRLFKSTELLFWVFVTRVFSLDFYLKCTGFFFPSVFEYVFLFSKQRDFELIIYLQNYVFFISCNSYVFCYFIHNYYSYLIVFLVRLGVYFSVVISGLRRIFRDSELTLKMVQVQEIFDYLLLIIAIDAFNGFLTMITFNFSCCGLFYVQCFEICDVNHRVLEELGGSQFNLNIYDLKLRVQEVLETMQNLFSFNTGLLYA
ncbi:unnamed protein product [Brugia pahangi]|uniref:COX2_CUA domain-containing protein n=1 Tax=Brugia pahangi TaxID=6280 RepID=A0A0N4T3Z3_BRUPA|nr:unnamed protein product [Brugia pahangi]